MKFIKTLAAVTATAVLTLVGCGGGGISGTGISSGDIRFSLTDAPACGYDHVNVTVTKVRVHQNANAVDADSGWSEVTVNNPQKIDLLTLTNGVLDTLGQTTLPAGRYSQLRLVLAPNGNGPSAANSVTPTGGTETALTTPSGQQTGIKLNVDMDVPAGQTADFVIDFDACKSIVQRGHSGQYNLKPVLTVIPVLTAVGQRVVGYVDNTLAANVSVQTAGAPVKATVPDANGRFELYPVPAGNYDLVITAAGHATAVMTGVPVTATANTTLNTSAAPITLPSSTERTVTGSVGLATVYSTATVRAQQALNGGTKVEVAWGAVDPTNGAFTFSLPVAAPVRTSYTANATSIVFTADTAAAGLYSLEASNNGTTLPTQSVDLGGSLTPITFTFP